MFRRGGIRHRLYHGLSGRRGEGERQVAAVLYPVGQRHGDGAHLACQGIRLCHQCLCAAFEVGRLKPHPQGSAVRLVVAGDCGGEAFRAGQGGGGRLSVLSRQDDSVVCGGGGDVRGDDLHPVLLKTGVVRMVAMFQGGCSGLQCG